MTPWMLGGLLCLVLIGSAYGRSTYDEEQRADMLVKKAEDAERKRQHSDLHLLYELERKLEQSALQKIGRKSQSGFEALDQYRLTSLERLGAGIERSKLGLQNTLVSVAQVYGDYDNDFVAYFLSKYRTNLLNNDIDNYFTDELKSELENLQAGQNYITPGDSFTFNIVNPYQLTGDVNDDINALLVVFDENMNILRVGYDTLLESIHTFGNTKKREIVSKIPKYSDLTK